MIKVLTKAGVRGIYLNIIKAVYDKQIANSIISEEKLKPFLLKSEMSQGRPLSPFLFNIDLEFLARAVRQEEELKGIQIRKEEIKLSLIADDMILYLKRPEKFLDIMNITSKVAGYPINL
jgi:hypothetical protein